MNSLLRYRLCAVLIILLLTTENVAGNEGRKDQINTHRSKRQFFGIGNFMGFGSPIFSLGWGYFGGFGGPMGFGSPFGFWG
ncbi:unnamed protein product [Thelazia callipaeda]|uniref:Uncharacterized protein n=1 Tax=Thelazia callipaeda TaxID=103827 RepID=A0A0N5DB69_THECL|nr:unnamed protein product [Thelazia callipaeda]